MNHKYSFRWFSVNLSESRADVSLHRLGVQSPVAQPPVAKLANSSDQVTTNNLLDNCDADVYGPKCEYARTLPSRSRFETNGDRLTASVIDPVFWTPKFPALYRLRIHHPPDEIACTTMLGLRRLEASRKSFFLQGERWVPRIIRVSNPPPNLDAFLSECHSNTVSIAVVSPSDELLEAASRLGVFVLLFCEANDKEFSDRISWYSQYPCVGICSVAGIPTIDPRPLAPTVLFSHEICDQQEIPAWAQCLTVSYDQLRNSAQAQRIRNANRPIIATRFAEFQPLKSAREPFLEVGRTPCDALQRDLAPEYDVAGYMI